MEEKNLAREIVEILGKTKPVGLFYFAAAVAARFDPKPCSPNCGRPVQRAPRLDGGVDLFCADCGRRVG